MSDEELTELAEEFVSDGEWKVDNETWDGTPYGVIRGAQGEIVVQEPVEFSAYASGAFITPAKMEYTLETIAKAHNSFPALVEELKRLRKASEAGEALAKAVCEIVDTEGDVWRARLTEAVIEHDKMVRSWKPTPFGDDYSSSQTKEPK